MEDIEMSVQQGVASISRREALKALMNERPRPGDICVGDASELLLQIGAYRLQLSHEDAVLWEEGSQMLRELSDLPEGLRIRVEELETEHLDGIERRRHVDTWFESRMSHEARLLKGGKPIIGRLTLSIGGQIFERPQPAERRRGSSTFFEEFGLKILREKVLGRSD